MIVFLDTCVICKDFYMKGTNFKLLKDNCEIVLSQIVKDEVKNKHKEKIVKCLENIAKENRELEKLTTEPLKICADEYLKENVSCYDLFLQSVNIENESINTIPYPKIDHQKVVEKLLNKKKPFKADKKDGYRDYLVWRSLLDAVSICENEPIHFITYNTKDFSSENCTDELHNDLIEEAKELGVDISKLRYWTSLEKFVIDIVIPELKNVEHQKQIANSLLNDNDDFINLLENLICKEMIGYDLTEFCLEVNGESPAIDAFGSLNDITILQLLDANSEEYLIEIRLNSICSIYSTIWKSELLAMNSDMLSDINIVNPDWNDHYALVESFNELEFQIQITYNYAKKQITSFDTYHIADYCPYCPY